MSLEKLERFRFALVHEKGDNPSEGELLKDANMVATPEGEYVLFHDVAELITNMQPTPPPAPVVDDAATKDALEIAELTVEEQHDKVLLLEQLLVALVEEGIEVQFSKDGRFINGNWICDEAFDVLTNLIRGGTSE